MTPVKTWLLLLLSVLFIAPTVSEVVQSMRDCGGFLLDNEPPHVPDVLENNTILNKNRYKVICQTYKDVRRFVTLYDTKNKIPVLSAYKFTGATGERKNKPWKIEPQLENENDDKNMKTSSVKTMYKNQSSNADYNDRRYDRGHLFPYSYAKTDDDKISTFTLTNAVPQALSFNRGSWAIMERRAKDMMESSCTDEAYVITGAQPSVNTKINKRVNVPSLLWSAFCCYSKNLDKWIAGAYWGDNVPNGPKQTLTLADLEAKLKKENKTFQVFPAPNSPQNLRKRPRDQC